MREADPDADPDTNGGLEPFPKRYPVAKLLSVVGDAWSPIVMHQLAQGQLDEGGSGVRYGVLLRSLPDISKKMLTEVLRRLERAGVVERTVIPTSPIGTLYALTERGERLLEPLEALCAWARDNTDLLDTDSETIRGHRHKIRG